jgi:predicted nuclease of predicted toxin-antitoxin system
VKLLVDENLPPGLCDLLRPECEAVEHVRDLDLARADDRVIWQYAVDHGFMVVTKDRDFADMAILRGGEGKVVWIRLGNCNLDKLNALLSESIELLQGFALSQSSSCCVLPPGIFLDE